MDAKAAVRLAETLQQFRSNRDGDSLADNDALVKMSGGRWQVKFGGRLRMAERLDDVPDVFEQMRHEAQG